jgi:hypothetical protein
MRMIYGTGKKVATSVPFSITLILGEFFTAHGQQLGKLYLTLGTFYLTRITHRIQTNRTRCRQDGGFEVILPQRRINFVASPA